MSSMSQPSRRSILAAAAAAIAASVARAFDRPLPVSASDDNANLQIGHTYADAQTQTTLANQANSERVLWVASNADLGHGDGVAITGYSNKTTGVEGWTDGLSGSAGVYGHGVTYGVYGSAKYGVYGQSSSADGYAMQAYNNGGGLALYANGGSGLFGNASSSSGTGATGHAIAGGTGVFGYSGLTATTPPVKTGVYGEATQDTASIGVKGRTTTGKGVVGSATSGVGLSGAATSGYAVRTSGRIRFDKASGVATIAGGATTVTVTPTIKVTSTSFVLLTPMANLGASSMWVTVDATNSRFTIHLSAALGTDKKVGWLVLG